MPDFAAAKSNAFMLGEATVLMGLDTDVYKLNPDDHAVGLVKNFQLVSDTGYVELTQGVQNTIVHSTMNKSSLRANFEVYEYTSKNLAYALGLNGASLTRVTTSTTLSAPTSGTAGTPDTAIAVASATGLAQGDWIIIQGPDQDQIYVDKIAAITGTDITLTKGIPDTLATATISKANNIDLASSVDQPYLSCAAVGKLADGTPVRVVMPKVRVSKGFQFQFNTQNYGNMPFELTVYRPVSTDTVYYSDFSNQAARMFVTA